MIRSKLFTSPRYERRGTNYGGTTMHHHSIREALELAESLDEDLGNYAVIRELRVQLRALLKDQEAAA